MRQGQGMNSLYNALAFFVGVYGAYKVVMGFYQRNLDKQRVIERDRDDFSQFGVGAAVSDGLEARLL